jgi:hypothetical protein
MYEKIYMNMIMMFIKLWQNISIGTFIFAFMTLNLEFDLLFKKFNIGNISWLISDKAFIFHLRISCDKTSVLVPSFLTLWPWSSVAFYDMQGNAKDLF